MPATVDFTMVLVRSHYTLPPLKEMVASTKKRRILPRNEKWYRYTRARRNLKEIKIHDRSLSSTINATTEVMNVNILKVKRNKIESRNTVNVVFDYGESGPKMIRMDSSIQPNVRT